MSPNDTTPSRVDDATPLWADMRRRHAQGERVRVEDYLGHPALQGNNPSLLLDLAYAEYALREMAGEAPTVAEFAQRFPQVREGLERQFAIHDALSSIDEHEAPPAPAEAPAAIGKYRVVTRLGEGGQGTVYRAVHPELGQDVVVKVGHQQLGPDAGGRLAEEGRALAGLRHPNLVRVLDLGSDAGRPYLVMEHIAGRNLEQVARQGHLSPVEAARLVAALARAVEYAHGRGVVHLDIKPANVLVGEDAVPRLLDFGLSRARTAWAERPDDTTDVSGTLAFMAPERLSGEQGQSLERADIFGLGGVLFYLLTDEPPFTGSSPEQVVLKAREGQWGRAQLDQPRVPAALREVCQKCLATNPAERYATAGQLAAELEAFAQAPAISRRLLIGGLVVAAAAAALGAYLFWPPAPAPVPQPTPWDPVPDPDLKVFVKGSERMRDLVRCLPLEEDNRVRIEAGRPAGLHAALLLADSDGGVEVLATAAPGEGEGKIVYPEGEPLPIKGRPGTDLVLLCARRSGPVDVAALKARLTEVRLWPTLPGLSLLQLGRGGVKVLSTGKGLGAPRGVKDPQGEVTRRLEKLGVELRRDHEVVVGLAVAHR